ncbi:flagellar hook-length control protein FliK [Candidatus Magnetaquicoccus inordinatus]|uniref:flagellar hook-length control protein FliK n=1 Tax=Candidatus Magnetaquicoccus inordinatus TaxID=2496818 RepID=UPI00102CC1E2|nr:flagellar hook-length control protein FliK [Candidatus Magnetaquicoccus inordinatus]
MIISGILLPTREALSSPTLPTLSLNVGDILLGRVTQLNEDGRGVVRFPDGSGFTFARAPTLTLGEPVQVEVTRLVPDLSFRLVASSSQSAADLAANAQQSLVRAPDIFNNLLRWSNLSASNQSLLQRALPPLSVQGLLQGDLTALASLLENGSQQDVRTMIQLLRGSSQELLLARNETTSSTPTTPTASLSTTPATDELLANNLLRNNLQRLSDLLAMQEILPRLPANSDGSQVMGYRLFWLMEGGLGEAIWYNRRQVNEREASEGDEEASENPGSSIHTSVLLSLNMTELGAIQARLSYGEGVCRIHIAAENEESLSRLRSEIGTLRSALLAAELPLAALDVSRLLPGELRDQRMRALGLASQFAAEA